MKLKIRTWYNVFSKIKIHIYNNHGFSQELLMRFTAALMLLIAAIKMDPETLGTNTIIGSLALCTASIVNPGYLYRIDSTSRLNKISFYQANHEWRFSSFGVFVFFPLLIHILLDVNIWIKISCSLCYVVMYGTLAFRDIQMARMKSLNIPTHLPLSYYVAELFLGILFGFLLFLTKQPFLIPLCTVIICLPMLIRFGSRIGTSGILLKGGHETSNPYSLISLKFAIFGVISSVLMVADNFLVFGLLGLGDLGHYGIAFAIVTLVVNIFGTTLQRQEFLTNTGGKPKTNLSFLIVAVLSALTLSFSVVIVGDLYQVQNLKISGFLALILCSGIPFRIRNLHVSVIIEKFGTFKDRIFSLILSIAILTIFSLVGIFVYDLIGLCIATSFSYFLIGTMNSILSEKVSTRVARS